MTNTDNNNQSYNSQNFNNQGFNNQNYNSLSYNSQGFNNQSYNNQGYDNQDFSNQNLNNQGYNNQNYNMQRYDNQSLNNQNYNNQGYNSQDFSNQSLNSQGYNNQNHGNSSFTVPYGNDTISTKNNSRILNPSTILGFLSCIFLTLGLFLPAMDFSHFHEEVDIQYSLIKICKNVGLLSSMWTGIPYGIIIGIIGIFLLSFVKIPVLKIIPCLLITAMVILMAADIGNIIEWVTNTLDKFYRNNDIMINFSEIIKSFLSGIYFLAAGIIFGFVSCFFKAPE
ncbi:MAG: hypothetical protein NC393_12900 [Clostridium sp.]|nr:hypothetical protein [Clostridium sp.]MCM1173009.1 hypothetical protein [Clostridium sp.]MCM1208747.1 hypothetical protein [Ruminococcus sp.]